jgi:hypothetical protein
MCATVRLVLIAVGLIIGVPVVSVEGAYFDQPSGPRKYAGVFSASAPGLLVDAFERVGASELGPVLAWESVEGDQVLFGVLEQLADLRRQRRQTLDHVTDALSSLVVVFGVEHLAQGG